MEYQTVITIIDPDKYNVVEKSLNLQIPNNTPSSSINYELVCAFFKLWDKKDKYSKIYALGVKSYKLI